MNIEEFKQKFFKLHYEKDYQDIECINFVGLSNSYITWEDIKDLVDWKNKFIVDIGCFHGYFSFKAESLGATCLGLDKSSLFLQTAKDIKEVIGSKVEFKEWEDTQDLPNCDITLCLNVFHYFKDQEGFLKKIKSNLVIFKVNDDNVDIIKKYFNILSIKDSIHYHFTRKVILGEKK